MKIKKLSKAIALTFTLIFALAKINVQISNSTSTKIIWGDEIAGSKKLNMVQMMKISTVYWLRQVQ
jgi:hypothetical protein